MDEDESSCESDNILSRIEGRTILSVKIGSDNIIMKTHDGLSFSFSADRGPIVTALYCPNEKI
jgi:hypothetical protein